MVDAERVHAEFDGFYATEFPRLVPMLHALTGSRADAEDLAQEAMRRAHDRWAEICAYDKPGAWVRRVALNLATNAARRGRRKQAALLRMRPLEPVELVPADDLLWALVRSLPEQQRWAVALHYVEDRSVADVAEILGIAEGTVKTHLSRARATLARNLGERESR